MSGLCTMCGIGAPVTIPQEWGVSLMTSSAEDRTPTRTALPTVTVIVPVKDGMDGLRKCVQALVRQDYPAELLQIIVVDNGSVTSPVPVLPGDREVTLLFERYPGSYRARNTGLGAASGEILAFTDADCVPSPNWISAAVRHLVDHPEVDMVGGRVVLTFRAGRPVNGPELLEHVTGFPQERYVRNGFAVTANMITRRQVFERVGPFDGTLQSGGDAEWGRRVRSGGGVAHYLASATVEHPARDTWGELHTKTVRTTEGVIRRVTSGPYPRSTLSRLLAGRIFRMVTAPVSAWREPRLDSASDRVKFLTARWRVDGLIMAAAVRSFGSLLRSGKAVGGTNPRID